MANSSDLKNKLGRRGAFTGWEDVVSGADPQASREQPVAASATAPVQSVPEEEIVRKTYLLHQWQVDQIAEQAKANGIQINEYVRALMAYVLDEVDAGKVQVSSSKTTIGRSS